jgi:RNA polymerase sigma-70 factor (ECF subfamily)
MRLRDRILAFILTLTRDYYVAEEILQELSLTVMKEALKGTKTQSCMAWFLATARHHVSDYYRRNSRHENLLAYFASFVDATEQSFLSYDAPLTTDERRIAYLRNCLAKLPPRLQNIMNARYAKMQPIARIAASISWNHRSVIVALSKARQRLANCIAQKLKSGVPE